MFGPSSRFQGRGGRVVFSTLGELGIRWACWQKILGMRVAPGTRHRAADLHNKLSVP